MLQVITHIYIVKNKECASHVFVVCLAKKMQNKNQFVLHFSLFYILSLSFYRFPHIRTLHFDIADPCIISNPMTYVRMLK